MRRAALRVSLEAFVDVLSLPSDRRIRVVGHQVPREARLVGLEIDTDRGELRLVLESPTFGELAPGAPVPELEPTLFREEGAGS
jgi:hypothetical protein